MISLVSFHLDICAGLSRHLGTQGQHPEATLHITWLRAILILHLLVSLLVGRSRCGLWVDLTVVAAEMAVRVWYAEPVKLVSHSCAH